MEIREQEPDSPGRTRSTKPLFAENLVRGRAGQRADTGRHRRAVMRLVLPSAFGL